MSGSLEFIRSVFQDAASDEAIVWRDEPYPSRWLLERMDDWTAQLTSIGWYPRTVVGLGGDFSHSSIALFLGLVDDGMMLVPFSSSVAAKKAEFLSFAEVEAVITIDQSDSSAIAHTGTAPQHPLIQEI